MKPSRCTLVIPCNAILFLILLCLGIASSPACLRAQGNEREIEIAKKRIHELLLKAEALEDQGKREAGQELRHAAEQMKRRIGEAMKRRAQQKSSLGEWKRVLHNLELGIAALKQLEKHEEAAHLREIANALRRRLEFEASRNKRERGGNRKRELAKRHLQILRWAKGAFAEAGKKDMLEMIERAMHASELAMEGRRDREAMRIMQRAPDNANLAELLIHAAKLLDEYRARDKARAVRDLARHLVEGQRRRDEENRRRDEEEEREERRGRDDDDLREERRRRERDDEEREARRERDWEEHAGRRERDDEERHERERSTKERIDRLEARLEELLRAVRELRRNREEGRRRR